MRLLNWLKPKTKPTKPPIGTPPLAGIAVVKYDQLKQHNYWDTSNADGGDSMSVTGGAPLSLDPKNLPLGTVIKIFLPGSHHGE